MKNSRRGASRARSFSEKARSSRRVRANVKGEKKALWKCSFFPVDPFAREADGRRKKVRKCAARSIPIKEMAM